MLEHKQRIQESLETYKDEGNYKRNMNKEFWYGFLVALFDTHQITNTEYKNLRDMVYDR